ncbi:MAG: hypothetical protein A4E28_03096 [Methanocella sp. PtaU1.Bin125]|nr:MAG: hypothetical protein A4E28_03096 [Methanocella sp. PtaU1.Bin125]
MTGCVTIPATKKSPATKKAPDVKAAVKKAAVKKTSASVKQSAAKKAAVKKPAKKAVSSDDGESIESLIARRDIDLKSVEEALGIKKLDTKHNPVIPGKFDLIIPPGTPRRLIVDMAREFNLEVAMRNDYYVPIGVSDIPRELLCFRSDEKTLKKMEKELYKRLKAWAK